MNKLVKVQFRVLFRIFLLRVVDLELLSADADVTRLLGQFAALLAAVSFLFTAPLMLLGGRLPQVALWTMEHFLIATTMLVVGLFSVLSGEAIFPEKRDLLILGPLPVQVATLFFAKLAALATAIGVSVVALNCFSGLIWPLLFAPIDTGLLGAARSLAAFWMTTGGAGAFVFFCVLAVHGVTSQLLPRRIFLRVSSWLQLAGFCLLLFTYILEPSLETTEALAAPENQRLLSCLPSYWFLGLFQQLNGSMQPAFAPLAQRAWMALGFSSFGAAAILLLAYFRTMTKIVEQPDIVAASRGAHWSPRFGSALQTAVLLFSVRTVLRSRQHRVILAFYLGIGFAITLTYESLQGAVHTPWHHVNLPLLTVSALMMCFAVTGIRVVFSLPFELRANWIFRIAGVRVAAEYLPPIRRSLLALGALPVWLASAAASLYLWPLLPATAHLLLLGLLGMTFVELGLIGFHKLPFTCSYLPGNSNVHLIFWLAFAFLVPIFDQAGKSELQALQHPGNYALTLAVVVTGLALAKWRAVASSKNAGRDLQFEEAEPPVLLGLGLGRE